MANYMEDRRRMVEDQIRCRGISDERVLQAMERVPRHRFLLNPEDPGAYRDHPLPIAGGQTISQPYMVALMTEALSLRGDETILEIGTGSGYQAALLAEMGCRVTSVERLPVLAESARAILAELGYGNIDVVLGDGSLGHADGAPYDRVLVTAAAPKIADPWVEQLSGGGLLVAPVGGRWGQSLIVATKNDGHLEETKRGGCVFVPLVGEHGWATE